MTRGHIVLPLVALAGANLAAAVLWGDDSPDRTHDLWIVHGWIQHWLHGVDVVSLTPDRIADPVDYPPWAIVAFLPLGLVPTSFLMLACKGATVMVMPSLAYLAARVMAPRAAPSACVVPALLILCWGAAIRHINIMTPVPLLLGLLAVRYESRPWLSGAALGMSLSKPHVALPFLVWASVRGRYRLALIAAAVPAAQLAVYCAWVGAGPVHVMQRWLATLELLYTGRTPFVGVTGVRGLLATWMPSAALVDATVVAFAAAAVVVMWRVRGMTLRDGEAGGAPLVLPLGAVLVALTFYLYWEDLTLLAPVFALVYFARDPYPPLTRAAVLVGMQAVLMIDIRQREWLVPLDFPPVPQLVEHSYRLVTLAALAYIVAVTRAGRPRPRANGSA